jgi:hypothetical protein
MIGIAMWPKHQGMVVFICVLCCIMGIVLFGFFGWHLYLVRSGAGIRLLEGAVSLLERG